MATTRKAQPSSGTAAGARKSPLNTPSDVARQNNISAPSKTGIAKRLPDFTSTKQPRKNPRASAAARTLTLPRKIGDRYARRGTPKSQLRGYGRSF